MKKILTYLKCKRNYIILLLVSIFVVFPLFTKINIYNFGHDSFFHISNIYGIVTNLQEGIFTNFDIRPIIANNFGYGTGIFYPNLPHVITAIIAFIFNGNVFFALKIVHLLKYILAAFFMYKLVNKVFKNDLVALVAGIFYITFPYTVSQVFIRDALAESFIIIFIPMILLGLYELFEGSKRNFYIFFVIGYVGIVNSHLVLAVFCTIFAIIYLLVNIKKVFTKENFKSLVFASILILVLISPFIAQLVQYNIIGGYGVFEDISLNDGTLSGSRKGLLDFINPTPKSNYEGLVYYVNWLAIILAIVAIVRYRKTIKEKIGERKFFWYLIISTIFCIFLLSYLCPWLLLPKFMQYIQFAWRLDVFLVFFLSILAALAFKDIKSKKISIILLILVIIFNLVTVFTTYNFERLYEKDLQEIDMSFYGMGWQREYLPTNMLNNLEYFDNRGNDVIVKSGKADVSIPKNNAKELIVDIENVDNATIELPKIYYLGYTAKLIYEDETEEKIEIYQNENGFIETNIQKDGTLVLTYERTIVAKIADAVCIITIAGIIIVALRKRVKK